MNRRRRARIRVRARITGTVQGVGFRPFIYNLAHEFGLVGWVLNSTDGVTLEVEGASAQVDAFLGAIPERIPPLARIDTLQREVIAPVGEDAFRIRHSAGDPRRFTRVSPDVCLCEDCRRELFNPADRRYRYPFINCTNCGPRYTIICDIPYDRPNTTMSVFPMCPACEREYRDPSNRRFHAQPNACAECGPHVWFEEQNASAPVAVRDDAITTARKRLAEGWIIAVKGLGGFHLACDAQNSAAVRRLRERKRRSLKPFAVMVPSIEWARRFGSVSEAEARLLTSIERPIVLLDRADTADTIAPEVAPHNATLGLFLPYTPLHELLLDENRSDFVPALVMTSANLSEEPIVIDNETARERLATLADGFLMHNRDICTRADDSVARIGPRGTVTVLRRARGYAPDPIQLRREVPPILAVGAELKNAVCLTHDRYAFLSQHIGDLKNAEAYGYFREAIGGLARLFRIEPKHVAYDLHPDYLSTRYALERTDLNPIGVQHHHAHIVSVMAEHDLRGKLIGVAFDGTGFGTDGTIWGGEFLIADDREFSRAAHLATFSLIGGDMAVREPERIAYALLHDAFDGEPMRAAIPFTSTFDAQRAALFDQLLRRRVNVPRTSSMGRLFDAVSALVGIRRRISYEAQAAIELEHAAQRADEPGYSFPLADDPEDGAPLTLDPAPLVREIVADIRKGVSARVISGRFHRTIADVTTRVCERLREREGLSRVALSGGVFQNRLLSRLVVSALEAKGFEVLTQSQVPPNDGGIALGQAYCAAARLEMREGGDPSEEA